MSMPMICAAAWRASSGVFTSLIPPALPRPPTGTCALTATGPSSAHAFAASSGVRATRPGGIGMPSDARTSLAWYSRSFTVRSRCRCSEPRSRRGGREGADEVGVAARIAVAYGALKGGIADDCEHAHDAEHDDHDEGDTTPDQDCGPGRLALCGRRHGGRALPGRWLARDWTPRGAIPVGEPVVGDPTTLGVLSRHPESLRLSL